MIWNKRVLTPFGHNTEGTSQGSKENKRHGYEIETELFLLLESLSKNKNKTLLELVKALRSLETMPACKNVCLCASNPLKKQKTQSLCGCAQRSFNKQT